MLNIRSNKVAETEQNPRMSALKEIGYRFMGTQTEFSDFGGIVKQDDVPDGITISKPDRSAEKVPCLIAMSYLGISPDGKAVGCVCFDGRGATTIGDVNESRLGEIWASEQARDFRYSFRNRKVPEICKTCAFYLPHANTFSNRGLKDFDPTRDSFWEKLV
jgi:radical SAM protein with 4Fe4S-binding SPASM domain